MDSKNISYSQNIYRRRVNMRYLELCAGVGGLSEGLNQSGHECVGYAECDTECKKCKSYTQHIPHPTKKFHTICTVCSNSKRQQTHECYQILHDPKEKMWSAYDIRSVTDDDIRDLGRDRGPIQMLVAGFPCQAFSIAGKREGFTDEIRGTVFFEIIRFASILRPEYILLENVTGLLNHEKGRTFETILETLDELGYVGEWQVLNSAGYVPQNRKRVFIVASLRGSGRRKIFPIGRENSNSVEVIGRIDIKADDYCKRVYSTEGIAPCLPTMQGGSQEPKVMVLGNTNPSGKGMNGQVYDAGGLAPTLTTNKGEGNKVLVNVSQLTGVAKTESSLCLDANYYKGILANQARTGVMEPIPVLTPDRVNKRQNGRRFKEPGEAMFTLTAQDKHGVAISTKVDKSQNRKRIFKKKCIETSDTDGNVTETRRYRIRKLTPLECFRLQSYPDWWYYKLKEHDISDSQLYKMAGNGVTRIVAFEIGKQLMAVINEK